MKLSYRIISRISIALLVLMAVWASLFYFIIIEEINDETDDSLENYSEYIITRVLAGEALPSVDNGTNNNYYLNEVTPEYAAHNKAIRYYDQMIYIQSKMETEPARILKTIFKDSGNKYYELTVSIPTIEKTDLQETILKWIVILYLILLIVIIIITLWILHRSFKPLYTMLNWLNNFSVEKKEMAIPGINTNISEFRKLNEAIVSSARRNIETYEQQKSFISHASHELQTPLSVCLNRLEMLLEDSQLTEKQLEEILKTKHSIEHIIKLNKTLLLLTKIENNQFPDKKEIVINEIIKKLVEDYSEVYENRQISMSLNENAVLKFNMNEMLAFVLFGNLLKNAYFHNHNNGSIRISISNKSISISNTGTTGNSKKEGSSGIGLMLCKSICKLYGINSQYTYVQNKHVFTLSF